MNRDPAVVALAYFTAWASHDIEQIMCDIAESCVFINGAVKTTFGAVGMRTMFTQYLQAYDSFSFDVLSLCTGPDGSTVLNERLDFMFLNGRVIAIPCAGAVVVTDGKITEIRDYFDFAAVDAQRAAD